MPTRYDVSAVPPQGGYVAKQCPVRAQWDAIRPCEPLAPPAVLERLFAGGRDFEADVVTALTALHPGAPLLADVDRDRRAEREQATLAAIRAGVPLIIGGRLPADQAGRRTGEPDLLVGARPGGYRAVDIKHHRSLRPRADGSSLGPRADASAEPAALCSDLAAPGLESAAADPTAAARRRRDDLLQLAHYQRMLEAAGLAPAGGRLAGIVGVERVVTWHDLDAPIWTTPSSSGRTRLRSTMEVYDFEFDFRLDIIAVAEQHLADPAVRPLVVPVRSGECPYCPWWSWCGPTLAAGSGDVSLLPHVGWRQWRVHRDHGVTDRAALAGLDHRTATLVAAGLDLRPILGAAAALPGQTPVADVIGERKRAQLAALAAAGITSLADARTLHPRTASYCDQPMADLPDQIDRARAALGDQPAYRARNVTRVRVPRADVEVDIDMENTAGGVYLWGALVTAVPGAPVRIEAAAGYRAVCSWEPMTGALEADLFGEFWRWLSALRRDAEDAGLGFSAYCYNAAEGTQMRRLAGACGLQAQVAGFLASPQWVDLLRVFDSQIVTGSATGLKATAALAGFSWSVQDPGGAEALARYDAATGTDQDAAAAARDWLLAYNEGDTSAMLALRDWLDRAASDCPPVQDAWPGRVTRVKPSAAGITSP